MKNQYELTQQDYEELLKACRPTRVMSFDGVHNMFPSFQENANRAWQELGRKMGFQWDSVEPSCKGDRFFQAEPQEGKEEA